MPAGNGCEHGASEVRYLIVLQQHHVIISVITVHYHLLVVHRGLPPTTLLLLLLFLLFPGPVGARPPQAEAQGAAPGVLLPRDSPLAGCMLNTSHHTPLFILIILLIFLLL